MSAVMLVGWWVALTEILWAVLTDKSSVESMADMMDCKTVDVMADMMAYRMVEYSVG